MVQERKISIREYLTMALCKKYVEVNGVVREVQYIDDQAEGAWPNGSVVRKMLMYDPVEFTPVGTRGKVVGSIAFGNEIIEAMKADGLDFSAYGYFIEWETTPDVPIFCVESKLQLEA